NAANVTVSDPVPSLTSYVPGTLRVAASAVDCSADPATAAAAGTGRSDTNGDADGGDPGSASAPWSGPITTATAALTAGTATTTIFQVTIDCWPLGPAHPAPDPFPVTSVRRDDTRRHGQALGG